VTNSNAIEELRSRARAIRARAAIRGWEYRQRHHAKGAWFRLRRLLAGAASAWSISEAEARGLMAEGYGADPAGALFEPPKVVLLLPEERVSALASRRRLDLRFGADLLAARWLALIPFEAPAVRTAGSHRMFDVSRTER
jgi:hypothetical protein